MNTRVVITSERKCYGTFDLIYNTNSIPSHGKRKLKPTEGRLSFQTNDSEVIIIFTEKQWKDFINEMKKVMWKEKEHFGQC